MFERYTFHDQVNEKEENLNGTYNWESSEQSHGSTNQAQLGLKLELLVPQNLKKKMIVSPLMLKNHVPGHKRLCQSISGQVVGTTLASPRLKRTLETNWFEMCSPKLIEWAEELKNIFFTRRRLCLRYASTSCFNCFGTSSKCSRPACFPETPTSAYTPTHGVLQLKLSSFDSLSMQSLPDGLHTFPS